MPYQRKIVNWFFPEFLVEILRLRAKHWITSVINKTYFQKYTSFVGVRDCLMER
jgi:hypothetical protein